MKTKMASCLLAFFTLQSCAQGGGKKENLPLKSFYEVTTENVQEKLDTYGLKGPLKSVEQRQYMARKDSLIDLEEYEVCSLREEAYYSLFAGAGMNSDCMLTFNEAGRLIYRVARGRRFSSEAVETDTLFYAEDGKLSRSENRLEGDDFAFHTSTVFDYDEHGRLIRQLRNGQPDIEYTYDEAGNQVRVVWHDNGQFMSDNMYTYDEYGLKIETHSYNEDGSLSVRWVHEYDDFGHPEKEFQYDPNGDTHESKKPAEDKTIKVYCQYDEYGNCTKRLIVDSHDRITVRERKFEYIKK